MEHQKILNLLNEPKDSKFVTRKWNIVNDQSNANYDSGNLTFNTGVLKSNLCDFNNAYILVRGDITITGHNFTQVTFRSCAPFTKWLNYSSNYSEPKGSLWFHSKDEAANLDADIADGNTLISFRDKT